MDPEELRRLETCIRQGINVCVLFRGLPGRGKTYVAERLAQWAQSKELSCVASAADDYMVDSSGNYCFDPENIGLCHSKCISKVVLAMSERVNVVIQHNTNTMEWESLAIRVNSQKFGYLVVIYDVPYAWATPEQIPEHLRDVLKNSHGVSDDKIDEMRKRSQQQLKPRYTAHWFNGKIAYDFLERMDSSFHKLIPESDRKVLLHCTTCFADKNTDIQLYDGFQVSVSEHDLEAYAYFVDDRGAGLLIRGKDKQFPANYNAAFIDDKRYPHVTLAAFEGFAAKDVGYSAYKFQELIGDGSMERDIMVEFDGIRGMLFSEPLNIHSIHAPSYSPTFDDSYMYYFWNFGSEFERDLCLHLFSRRDVNIVNETVPASILPGGWRVLDIKVSPPRGRSDDEAYDSSVFLREFVPRGFSWLVSPENRAIPMLAGLSKFTGFDDDKLGMNPQTCKYFTKSIDSAQKPWILVTEKANGEAAHARFIRIGDSVYILSGSKNVHMLTRLGHPEDILCYENNRFQYAKEITEQWHSELSEMDPAKRDYLVSYMIDTNYTAIFEFENPDHAHVVPLLRKALKFITFTKIGFDQRQPRSSYCPVSPVEAFAVADLVGLDRVWSFNARLEEQNEVQAAILEEKGLVIEGCVLYFMDGLETIGLVKCKTASYICSRAAREKFVSFLKGLERCSQSFSSGAMSKSFMNIMKCETSEQKAAAFNSSFQNIVRGFGIRIQTTKESIQKQFLERFQAISAEQAPLTNEEIESWVSRSNKLFDYYSQVFCESITSIAQAAAPKIEESLNGDNDTAKAAINELSEAVKAHCETEYNSDRLRGQWPSIWAVYSDKMDCQSV